MPPMWPRQNDVKNEHEDGEQYQIEKRAFGYHKNPLAFFRYLHAGASRIIDRSQRECHLATIAIRWRRRKFSHDRRDLCLTFSYS